MVSKDGGNQRCAPVMTRARWLGQQSGVCLEAASRLSLGVQGTKERGRDTGHVRGLARGLGKAAEEGRPRVWGQL